METVNRRFFILTRRQFIKIMMAGAAALGLGKISLPKWAYAEPGKPAVIWLEGQNCAGCTESVITYEGIKDVILDVVAIRYHETIMAAAGDVAIGALDATINEGGYVLVVEGSIPLAEGGDYCVVAGETFEDTVKRAAGPALGILAIGAACATYGGIPRVGVTVAKGVEDVIDAAYLMHFGCKVHDICPRRRY